MSREVLRLDSENAASRCRGDETNAPFAHRLPSPGGYVVYCLGRAESSTSTTTSSRRAAGAQPDGSGTSSAIPQLGSPVSSPELGHGNSEAHDRAGGSAPKLEEASPHWTEIRQVSDRCIRT